MPFLCISSDLQHIRDWKPQPGHPCPHLYPCVWPEVSHQHAAPQREHTQAPEREWWVETQKNCHNAPCVPTQSECHVITIAHTQPVFVSVNLLDLELLRSVKLSRFQPRGHRHRSKTLWLRRKKCTGHWRWRWELGFAPVLSSHCLVLVHDSKLAVFQPQPLAFLEEDIREVLKRETGADIFSRADQPNYRLWKQNVGAVTTLLQAAIQHFLGKSWFCWFDFRWMGLQERCESLWCWTPGRKTASIFRSFRSSSTMHKWAVMVMLHWLQPTPRDQLAAGSVISAEWQNASFNSC